MTVFPDEMFVFVGSTYEIVMPEVQDSYSASLGSSMLCGPNAHTLQSRSWATIATDAADVTTVSLFEDDTPG